MQLLVSVRSAAEVGDALSGGADIIDAKEPRLGSLGQVSPDVLGAILDRVPPERDVSVALGDFRRPHDVRVAIESLPSSRKHSVTYLKLGFAGISGEDLIVDLLQTAVEASSSNPSQPRIIAVAYADAEHAGSVAPEVIGRAASQAGAAGVLFDTYGKVSGNLLDWLEPEALAALIEANRSNGLLSAVAGGLGTKDLARVAAARPDIVGFRGAACAGGRDGTLSRRQVRQLSQAVFKEGSGSIQEPAPSP